MGQEEPSLGAQAGASKTILRACVWEQRTPTRAPVPTASLPASQLQGSINPRLTRASSSSWNSRGGGGVNPSRETQESSRV